MSHREVQADGADLGPGDIDDKVGELLDALDAVDADGWYPAIDVVRPARRAVAFNDPDFFAALDEDRFDLRAKKRRAPRATVCRCRLGITTPPQVTGSAW
ncbi:MAG: hypothetical protein WAN20_03600 [Pseudonocardiaceae bacterium]|nr:hypothetical protein [Pseudonocardiaceae bacterium]